MAENMKVEGFMEKIGHRN